jgi:integrase
MKPVYSVPKLIKYDDLKKTWYVYFRYNGKVIKKTEGMGYIHSRKEREHTGLALAKALHQRLKEGWNPLVPDLANIEGSDMTFYQALEFALEKKRPNIAVKSHSTYGTTVKYCKEAVRDLNISFLPITDTKRVHIKTLLEHIKTKKKLSNTGYNKHLHALQAVLSELLQWDIIETNPAHNIKPLRVMESRSNFPPTPEQHQTIKQRLSVNYPDFWKFVSLLFHTGIRPVEITNIKLNMIDVESRTITLPAMYTKTGKERIVPINQFLWEDIKDRLNNPGNYYLFGSFRQSARGNVGPNKDFIAGPTKLNRDTATKRWEKLVKIEMGIDVNLYAYKHFGADMKILAGVDLPALSVLYGHTSTVTTEIYARAVKQVHRKQLMDLSPDI